MKKVSKHSLAVSVHGDGVCADEEEIFRLAEEKIFSKIADPPSVQGFTESGIS
jgi:hypothetical protein